MGVQVLLAVYAELAPRVRALVLLSGSAASPLRTPFDLGLAAGTYYAPLQQTNAWLPGPVRRLIWQGGWDHLPFHDLGPTLGLFATGTDPAVAAAYAREAGGRDPDAALALAADMHAYDAEDVLAQITVPALVVTGERDPFCSPTTARRMASRMARAEVRVVDGGSHSTLLDDAEVVNGWVLDHLAATAGRARVAGPATGWYPAEPIAPPPGRPPPEVTPSSVARTPRDPNPAAPRHRGAR